MVFKNLCTFVLWRKEAVVLEGLNVMVELVTYFLIKYEVEEELYWMKSVDGYCKYGIKCICYL